MATQLKPGDLGALKVMLGDVAAYWVAIADQLGMTSQVANIKSAVLNVGPSHFLRDLLERWLSQDPPPPLEALCKALRADHDIIGGAKVARELEEKFSHRREGQLYPGDLGALKVMLGNVAAYWVAIADQLGMTSQVANIKSAVLNVGPSHFLRDLLERWLSQDPPPTLEALCKALRADREIIGGARVARELKEKLSNKRGSGSQGGSTNPTAPTGTRQRVAPDSGEMLQEPASPLQPAPSTTQTRVIHPESTSVYPREAVADVQPRGSDGLAVKHWGLEGFHKDGLTGKNTVIAIIDSGINRKHNGFKKKGKIHHASKNFLEDRPNGDITDDNGHGTRSAGIAAGLLLEDEFPIGVAPEAQLLVCRVSVKEDEPQTMIKALQYLTSLRKDGTLIDIVSISLGYQLDPQQEREVKKAVDTLVQDYNTVVVAAACNNGHQRDPIWYPAKCGDAISIGAHDHNKNRAGFSPVGQRLDFLAPGVKILSSTKGSPGATSTSDGTSCAVPAVAGLIALLIQCAREAGGPASTRISNRTVMMYLLKQMSSHEHTSERGYGALEPKSLLSTLTRENAAGVLHGHIIEALNNKCDCEECKRKRTTQKHENTLEQ